MAPHPSPASDRWLCKGLERAVARETDDPTARLLATFAAIEGWVAEGFDGCPFIIVAIEADRSSPRKNQAAAELAEIRAFLELLADNAGLQDPAQFATAWHLLLHGAVVGAHNGDAEAIPAAGHAARLLLDGWDRR